jgi:subtilase family serine protease
VVAVGGGNLITSSDPADKNDLNARYITENAYADPEPPSDFFGFGNTLKNLWWGAGGGQSILFPKPKWQKGITPGTTRSVPDIGLFVGGCFADDSQFVQPCADDVTHAVAAYNVTAPFPSGGFFQTIGTSVAAPEAAALLADSEDFSGSRKVPGSGRLGKVSPLLYALPGSFFHQDIPGYNGVVSFSGTHRWNVSYGLGSLFNQTPFTTSALTPQSPSNP